MVKSSLGIMSGPPRKPTAQRLLEGDLSKGKKLNKSDPSLGLREEIPKKPEHGLIDKEASDEWDRLVKLLKGTKIIARTDEKVMLALANTWSILYKAEKRIADEGLCVMGKSGLERHPCSNTMEKARSQYITLLSHTGMTPAARAKLIALEGEEAQDEFQAFLNAS